MIILGILVWLIYQEYTNTDDSSFAEILKDEKVIPATDSGLYDYIASLEKQMLEGRLTRKEMVQRVREVLTNALDQMVDEQELTEVEKEQFIQTYETASRDFLAPQNWDELCEQINSGADFGRGQPLDNFDPSNAPNGNFAQRPYFDQADIAPKEFDSENMEEMRMFRNQLETVCADGCVDDQEEQQLEDLFDSMSEQVRGGFMGASF